MSRVRWMATLCSALVLVALLALRAQPGAGEWRYYHADAGGSKYSPLDLINTTNVTRLHVAWRRPALDPELKASVPGLTASNYYRATPLMIDGRLFVQNGLGFVEELEATRACPLADRSKDDPACQIRVFLALRPDFLGQRILQFPVR